MERYMSLHIFFTFVIAVVSSVSYTGDNRATSTGGQISYSTFSGQASVESNPSESSYKEESLSNYTFNSNCMTWELEPDEFIFLDNETLYVEAYNKTYDSSAYYLHGNFAIICIPESAGDDGLADKFSEAFTYVAKTCLAISIICLILHLIAFCLIAELRNMPGCNTAALCASLLLGYIFHLIADMEIEQYKAFCVTVAALTYFFFLSAFLWMSVTAFDVFNSLLIATGKLRLKTAEFKKKKFSLYCAYCWGLSMVLVACALILDNVDGIPDDYRPMFAEICWFDNKMPLLILFATPVFAVTLANIVFFGLTARTIYVNRMKTDAQEHQNIKKYFIIYLRLSIIMGTTWIFGVISSAVDESALWYIYTILNASQGLLIFLAFTCSVKVRNYIREKLRFQIRRPSTVTLPTFQTYCNYDYSINENDNVS